MALGNRTPDPVRLHIEDDARLPKRLVHILQDRIDGYTHTIMSGSLEFDEYKYLTGTVSGLREALQTAENIAKDLED